MSEEEIKEIREVVKRVLERHRGKQHLEGFYGVYKVREYPPKYEAVVRVYDKREPEIRINFEAEIFPPVEVNMKVIYDNDRCDTLITKRLEPLPYTAFEQKLGPLAETLDRFLSEFETVYSLFLTSDIVRRMDRLGVKLDDPIELLHGVLGPGGVPREEIDARIRGTWRKVAETVKDREFEGRVFDLYRRIAKVETRRAACIAEVAGKLGAVEKDVSEAVSRYFAAMFVALSVGGRP